MASSDERGGDQETYEPTLAPESEGVHTEYAPSEPAEVAEAAPAEPGHGAAEAVLTPVPVEGSAEAAQAPLAPTDAAPAPAPSEPVPSTPAPAVAGTVLAQPEGATPKKAKKKAPQTERERLEALVEEHPRVAVHWLALLQETQRDAELAATRSVYDRFFTYFPNAGAQWIAYAELELAHSNFAQVDAIFVRCLRTTLSLDLWRFYLQYTRRVNPLPPFTGEDNSPREQVRHTLEGAYEFALKYIGWDRESGVIWQEYINLLRDREAQGSWQEGQKMDQLRRVFRRAVVIPLNQVEAIWRDYDAYENALGKLTAKKFLAESSPGYMQARSVLRTLRQHTEHLARPALPELPCWVYATDAARPAAKERQRLHAWRTYLAWEETNPLMLEDTQARHGRVLSAYRQAVMYMRFDAVLWFQAANYSEEAHRESDAQSWYKAGLEACPWSLLLAFGYASLCRAQGNYADGTAALDALVAYSQRELEQRIALLHEALAQVDEEVETERLALVERRKRLDAARDDDGDTAAALADSERRLQEERVQRKAQIEDERKAELGEWKDTVAQVWIKYMHFVRRAEGIRATRQVFGRARKSPHCAWQVYEANAMLEYHCSKEPLVATKVFELALRTFGADEHLVVRYLDFLISINDDTNARAVLERTVNNLPAPRARPIWERWAAYEYSFGDTSAIARLDARLRELYPDESRVEAASGRLRYGTLDAVRVRDMGYSHVGHRARKERREDQEEVRRSESPAPAPAKTQGAGRQSMEEIRKSLLQSDAPRKEGEKRGGAKTASAPNKKPRPTPAADIAAHRRMPRSEPTPPPMPSLPEALLYFLRYANLLTSLLPHAQAFDGPVISPDTVLDCVMHSSLPMVQLPGYADRKRRTWPHSPSAPQRPVLMSQHVEATRL